ncbi:MAG TPA: Calx-beta domain-containing protein [Kiritimatiellia bacterium]|nr:Calx-beta domain-containing protein [Kiritimatiellia bacterium]HPS07237.1 Calx-beta domain-containing protein [Kiritimatiellia bacterium]
MLASAFAMFIHAQTPTPRDFAVDLRASVSTSTPCITLSWSQRQQSKIAAQRVYRRLKTTTGAVWEMQATLATNDTGFSDTSALPGVEYEYWMQRTYSGISPSPAVGYLSAGVEVPAQEARGTLLLVVDHTMASPLAPEIAQLRSDLTGDGWTVQTLTALRTDTAANVKAQIKAAYSNDPANVKMVYLLGHVPVPYSGNIAPDGHGDHVGAWPADGYYGDMDGIWTDTSVSNTAASRSNNDNVPGDGKFDQSYLPSQEELMIGRVDLHSMTRAPSSATTETMLLRRYLRKAHDFRHKQGAYAAIPRRSVLRDGFGQFGSEAFSIAGWSWMFSTVGLTVDEPPSDQWFSPSYAGGKDYLVGYANGGGSYESASSVGNTVHFGLKPSRAVFTSLFGSYFGDWDSGNNFLRAPLAGTATGDSLGLTCFWGGRPNRFMHHMGMGETAGFATMISHNGNFWGTTYQPNSYAGVHCGLMGDPALRLHAVEPPRNLSASSANTRIELAWTASTETNLRGYHIYRAATAAGPFARLTEEPLSDTSYTDADVIAGQSYAYLVRTLKLETSPGGSYFNFSVGSPVSLTASAATASVPRNPTSLSVTQASSVNAQLAWTDNASDETGFRIERKTNPTGAFTPVGMAAANVTTFTDAGPFSHGDVYYYRILATNAAGDSASSPEDSFEAVAGHFDLTETRKKVSKTAGNVTVTVNRFGGVTGAASVSYATSDSSAFAGTHYTAASGTLTWADGETGAKTITVPIINTAAPQAARQFKITLSGNSSNTGLTVNNKVSVLIEDPTASLAAPWSQTTLGSVTDYSSAVLIDGLLGSVTLGAAGFAADTTGEKGRFIYQNRTGDGILTAHVPAGLPSDANARIALMIRSSTASTAVMAASVASVNSSFGAKLAYRTSAGGGASLMPSASNTLIQPCWLRLTRSGAVFTAEASANGTAWTVLGTATISGMPPTAMWGIFHYSTDWSITSLGNYHLAFAQNITFEDLPLPATPTGLTAVATTPTAIKLTWNSVAGASGYRIERRGETNDFAQIVDLASAAGTTQTYTDVNVTSDTAYAYRVSSYNTSGASAPCAAVFVTTPLPYATTTLTTDDAGGADATLQLDLADTPLGTGSVVTVAGFYYNSGTSSTILTNSAKTYLRFNLAGIGTPLTAQLKLAFSDARLFESHGYYYINAVLLAETSDGWNEESITWSNAPQNNVSSYGFTGTVQSLGYLYEEQLPTAGETVTMSLNAATLFNNRGANNLVTLALNQYAGASMDWASREHPAYAPPTLEISYTNPLPNRASFFTAATGSVFSVELSWRDNAFNETGFDLERSENGGDFSLLQMLAANTTNYTDTATQAGVTYSYRIRAVNAAGSSSWSSIATLATPDAFHAWGTVWDAGGANALFTTPANWDLDALPSFDGTAYLNFASAGSLATVNINASLSGISLHSAGDFTLGDGNCTLTLGAGGIRAAAPDAVTSYTYTVASDVTLAANQTWGATNNGAGIATLVVSGVVSDAGSNFGITKSGDGPLVLAGNNRYGGATLVTSGGVLRVTHSNALGNTNGNTTVQNGAWMEVSGNVSVPEHLTLNGDAAVGYAGALRSTGGTNTWSGAVTMGSLSRISALSGSSFALTGGITAPNIYLSPETESCISVTTEPLRVGSGKVYAYGQGVIAFGATGNTWGTLEIGGTTVRTVVPNTFPPTSILSMGTALALDATVDLNGNDQTVAQLKRGLPTVGNRLVTSATPATLTVNYTGGTTIYYDGQLNGALSLTKTGGGHLQLLGTNSTFSGSLTVSNGTVTVAANAPLGSCERVAVDGGLLKLPATSTIPDHAILSVADGAKVNLSAGLVETVAQLVLGGSRKWKGTWGATGSGAENIDDAHFTGTGIINLPSGTSSAWDGGAATTDINAPFNWDYDDLPALFDGSRTLSFGVGGELATVNTNVNLYGMILNRAADFTFAPGGGAISLGAGGLCAGLSGETPHTYTVGAPLELAAPQTWCVTNGVSAMTTLIVAGTVSDGGANHALSKSGAGTLSLAGDNGNYGGEILVLSNSVLRVGHALGLGNTNAPTTVQGSGRLEVGGGVTVAEPLRLNGDTSGAIGALYAVSGTNTWAGTITQSSPSRIGATAGSTLVLAASVIGYDLYLSPDAGSCVTLAGQPLLMGSRKLFAHGSGTLAIGVAGNTWSSLEIGGATVRLDVPGALPASAILALGTSGDLDATLDLNGNDQTVGQLKRGLPASGNRLVTSAKPATLTVNQTSSSYYYDGAFGGALSLVKSGAGTLYLLGTNSTYHGETRITGGTLRVEPLANLGNSSCIKVEGGTLRLRSANGIPDAAGLAIATSGAVVSIDAGLVETVKTLRIGSVLMRRGTYGATGSGANVTDDTHFSGTGQINVLRGTESVISIR